MYGRGGHLLQAVEDEGQVRPGEPNGHGELEIRGADAGLYHLVVDEVLVNAPIIVSVRRIAFLTAVV